MLDVDTLEFPLDHGSLQMLIGIFIGEKILKEAYVLQLAGSKSFVNKWRAKLQACTNRQQLHALIDECIVERSRMINWKQAYPQDYQQWVRRALQRERELEALSLALRDIGERQWHYDREQDCFTYARYWKPIPHVDHPLRNRFYSVWETQDVASEV